MSVKLGRIRPLLSPAHPKSSSRGRSNAQSAHRHSSVRNELLPRIRRGHNNPCANFHLGNTPRGARNPTGIDHNGWVVKSSRWGARQEGSCSPSLDSSPVETFWTSGVQAHFGGLPKTTGASMFGFPASHDAMVASVFVHIRPRSGMCTWLNYGFLLGFGRLARTPHFDMEDPGIELLAALGGPPRGPCL